MPEVNRDGESKKRLSRLLEHMQFSGKERTAARVVGAQFVRFGPETQDRLGDLIVSSIRQDHFREEVIAALLAIGVKLTSTMRPSSDGVA